VLGLTMLIFRAGPGCEAASLPVALRSTRA
jgi:hypothetical protein